MFWGIGAVARTAKIDRELQQNHNRTHAKATPFMIIEGMVSWTALHKINHDAHTGFAARQGPWETA
jgi:hypothetical protein